MPIGATGGLLRCFHGKRLGDKRQGSGEGNWRSLPDKSTTEERNHSSFKGNAVWEKVALRTKPFLFQRKRYN